MACLYAQSKYIAVYGKSGSCRIRRKGIFAISDKPIRHVMLKNTNQSNRIMSELPHMSRTRRLKRQDQVLLFKSYISNA